MLYDSQAISFGAQEDLEEISLPGLCGKTTGGPPIARFATRLLPVVGARRQHPRRRQVPHRQLALCGGGQPRAIELVALKCGLFERGRLEKKITYCSVRPVRFENSK